MSNDNRKKWDKLSDEEKLLVTQDAIDEMESLLDEADRDPREAKIDAQYDQYGAALRDMDDDEWERAVISAVETSNMTEDEVRNWFGRLSGKCAYDDAVWTGRG